MARAYRSTAARSCRSTSLAGGERPRGTQKTTPIRRSARLQQSRTPQSTQALLISQENSGAGIQLQRSTTTASAGQKRKLSREIRTSSRPSQKRQRPSSTAAEDTNKDTASNNGDNDPIDYWRKHLHWPQKFFETSSDMSQAIAGGSSSSTPRRKASMSSVMSSETTREKKSISYQKAHFTLLLETKDSFMGKYTGDVESGPQKKSINLCQALLQMDQDFPQDSLFSDEFFEETCEMIRERNEAKVIQDITRLIVPSAQTLSVRGSRHLRVLIESVNETWARSIPLHQDFPQPKPDYSVGFRWSSFTSDQFEKLKLLIGDIMDKSRTRYSAGTFYMYFPFLTCEVKCGAAALDIADRQNVHSATLAVRAVVELFREVKREKELNREILAFSISHDHRSVRIYGHYPVIDGQKTMYYRHLIHTFDFTALDGKDKWTTYKFTKNVYDNWMPDHFKRICSAIDDIPPDINLDISQSSELQFSSQTGLSQELESHHLSQSESSASVAGRDDGSSVADVGHATPNTTFSQGSKPSKRKR